MKSWKSTRHQRIKTKVKMPLQIIDISKVEPVSSMITAKDMMTQRYQKTDLYIQWSKPLTTLVLSSTESNILFLQNSLRIQRDQMKQIDEAPPSTYPKWRESSAFRFKSTLVFSINIAEFLAALLATIFPFAS